MAVIVSSVFRTAQFDFDKKSKLFTQEISTLCQGQRRLPVFTQIYDDACDIGLKLISDHTGKEIVFVVAGEDTDGEDIHGWRLEPTTESIRKVPECANLKMLIIND
jgi:hypothetical protein